MDKEELQKDAELVEIAKNNPETFGSLMERYQSKLFFYIRRLGQFSEEDAEDLLQEVFIKIYQKLNEYEEDLKFSSWAYRITHNHVIDHFRKTSARQKSNAMSDEDWNKLIAGSINIEKEIGNKDCVEKIKKYIEQLPLNYREVLILRFLEEKDYEEIMDILKKPKGTVATAISRGKEMLVKRMKEDKINC